MQDIYTWAFCIKCALYVTPALEDYPTSVLAWSYIIFSKLYFIRNSVKPIEDIS